jgi:hypothetical protein
MLMSFLRYSAGYVCLLEDKVGELRSLNDRYSLTLKDKLRQLQPTYLEFYRRILKASVITWNIIINYVSIVLASGIDARRWANGYYTCMSCGEVLARQKKFTVAPMHKSNYMLISNTNDLKGLNNKGGLVK